MLSADKENANTINSQGNIPTLQCAKFQESLWIEFGNVSLGRRTSRSFMLLNPSSNKTVSVTVERVPHKLGFSVEVGEDSCRVDIKPLQSVAGIVHWIPETDMAVREVILMKLDGKASIQVVLRGSAGLGNKRDSKEKVRIVEKPRKERSLIPEKASKISAVASKANTISEEQSVTNKQEAGFVEWLNHTYSKGLSDSLSSTASSDNCNDEDDDESLTPVGQGLRRLQIGLKETTAHCTMATLLKSNRISTAISAIASAVDEGVLQIREDQNIQVNVGLQQFILETLFKYEWPWLRLALEAIIGVPMQPITVKNGLCNDTDGGVGVTELPCVTGCAKWKAALKTYFMEHIATSTKDAFPSPNAPTMNISISTKKSASASHFESHLKSLVQKCALKKILVLILSLDCAREQGVLTLPTLFTKEATIKSSKEVLQTLCAELLRNEGDYLRHLASMGYGVTFQQSYSDEFDYIIKSGELIDNLRDGLRLARLVELLTKKHDLCQALRLPAVSRLQKLHNVGMVLEHLNRSDESAHHAIVDVSAVAQEARMIVDGHRETIMVLLWRLMYSFELKLLLSASDVVLEASRVSSSRHRDASTTPRKTPGTPLPHKITSQSPGATLEHALLQWCNAVCGRFNLSVSNLSGDFADGRALCMLVHFYQPTVLPLNTIKEASSALSTRGSGSVRSRLEQGDQTMRYSSVECDHRNFTTLRRACRDIGDIPLVLPAVCDRLNLPDQKTVAIFLSFLYSRLTQSSNSIKAAVCIQRFVRMSTRKVKKRDCGDSGGEPKFRSVNASIGITDVRVEINMPRHQPVPRHHSVSTPVPTVAPSLNRQNDAPDEFSDSSTQSHDDQSPIQESRISGNKSGISLAQLLSLKSSSALTDDAASTQAPTAASVIDEPELDEAAAPAPVVDIESFLSAAHTAKTMAENEEEQAREYERQEIHRIAEAAVFAEREARIAAELRLRELEQVTRLNAQLAHEGEVKRRQLEEELQDQLRSGLEDARSRIESESQLFSETRATLASALENERQARLQAEASARSEAEARLALEMRLNAFERRQAEAEAEALQKRENERQLAQKKQLSTVTIQSFGRMVRCRMAFLTSIRAIVRIQALHRQRLVIKRFRPFMFALHRLQATWKSRREKGRRKVALQAVVTLQSLWRGVIARVWLSSYREAARLIARWVICRRAVESFRRNVRVAVRLQSWLRAAMQSNRYRRLKRSVVNFQAVVRSFQARQLLHALQFERSVIFDQELRHDHWLQILTASARLAGFLYRWIAVKRKQRAVTLVARWFKARRPWLRARNLTRGFKRLQACFLSQAVKRASTPAVAAARFRVRQADINSQKTPQLRLGNLSILAVKSLMEAGFDSSTKSFKITPDVAEACATLASSTQNSMRCCEMVQTGVAEHLFALVRFCDRSPEHEKILSNILSTLLNVSRHVRQCGVIAVARDATEVLVDQLQMFRDKTKIFCLAGELLCRLVGFSDTNKDLCNDHQFRRRIEGVSQILERRHRVDMRLQMAGTGGAGARRASVDARSAGLTAGAAAPGGGVLVAQLLGADGQGRVKGRLAEIAEIDSIYFIRYLIYLLNR